MLGGETDDEILQVMRDPRTHNVDMLTLGQYLQPPRGRLPVLRYRTGALQTVRTGFRHAACGNVGAGFQIGQRPS